MADESGGSVGKRPSEEVAEESPFRDKRPRVLDPDAVTQPWFHTVGMGKNYLRGEIPAQTTGFMRRNGFFFHDATEKSRDGGTKIFLSHLCQDRKPLLLEAGPLNLVFMNDYISWSIGKETLGADKVLTDTGTAIGDAFRDFGPEVREWLGGLGIGGESANAEIIRMFRSDQVVQNARPASLRINYSKMPDPEEKFLELSPEGSQNILLPSFAGYWRVSFPRIHDVPTPVPAIWRTALSEAKFSYRFFPASGDLFFSNTLGAKYGLPPTAKHMGLPKLTEGSEFQNRQCAVADSCSDCTKHKEEIADQHKLIIELLSKKKSMGSFTFPAGITKFAAEGVEFTFQYKGKVYVKK
jgi:hypothetical protein